MKRNNKYFNVKDGRTIGISINGNYIFNVEGPAPIANFTVDNNEPWADVTDSRTIQFTDTSTENPTSWLWDFGDGTTSTVQNPIKNWTRVGAYTVKLTATNAFGSDTETKIDFIFGQKSFRFLLRKDGNSQAKIPANETGYIYNYSTRGFEVKNGLTGDTVLTTTSSNTYHATQIFGEFPWYNNGSSFVNSSLMNQLYHFGTQKWKSLERMFINTINLSGWRAGDASPDNPDLSECTSLYETFRNSGIRNFEISDWDVSNIEDMEGMLLDASNWNTDIDWSDTITGSINVKAISSIVRNSPITSLKLQAGAVTSALNAFDGAASLTELILIDMPVSFDITTTGLTGAAIDALADSVADMTGKSQPNITMSTAQLNSCDSHIWYDKNWKINNHISVPFIMEVNSGASGTFAIPTTGTGYNYQVRTSDGQTITGVTGNRTITFPSTNTDYIIKIYGAFPRIHFNNTGDKSKVKDIKQWGDIQWSSFEQAFYGCNNMSVTATVAPDLSNVTNMRSMFQGCTSLTSLHTSNWNVSNVQNFNSWIFNTNVQTNIDFSNPVTGSISATDMDYMVSNSGVKSLNVQASNVDNNPYPSGYNGTPINVLRLYGQQTNINIQHLSSTLVTFAIDNLANSVADMTGKTKPTITMTNSQINSGMDITKWTNKNWNVYGV